MQLEKELALTPALSPRRGRIFGSLFRESPFGESVRRCGKRHIAAPKGSRGPPPHSPQLHRSGPRRGRSVGSLQAYSPFGEFVNLRALATVAGRLTCDID